MLFLREYSDSAAYIVKLSNTWRHNSVLASLIRIMRPCLNQGMEIFSDLPGYLAPGGGSIPPDVLVTNQRPDIFIVNYSSREAIVL